MIRSKYQNQLQPPAPFVYVTLRNPVTGAERQNLPAQIDTAADRTLLPDAIAGALALQPIGMMPMGGVGGILLSMPSYLVQVTLEGSTAVLVEAVSNPDEQWVLLGRDVLNAYRILLDGPQLALEFE